MIFWRATSLAFTVWVLIFFFFKCIGWLGLVQQKKKSRELWEKQDTIDEFIMLYLLFYLFSFSILFPSHFPPGSVVCLYLSLLKQVRKICCNKQNFFGLFQKGRSWRSTFSFFFAFLPHPPIISISKLFPSFCHWLETSQYCHWDLSNCKI